MRILLIIDSLVGGGAQRQLVGLAKLLKQRGVQVKVITYHYIPFYLSLLVDSGVDYENIYKARNKCTRLYYIRRAIICYRPDWVIAYLDTPNILACMCKLLGGRFKLIISERNTTQKLTSREKFKFLLYRIADKIVPNSYSQERFILNNHLCNKEKLKTITNFVDIEYFSPLAQKKDSRDICRVICVGRIAEQKNILRFIQAVQILSKMMHVDGHVFPASNEPLTLNAEFVDGIHELPLEQYAQVRHDLRRIAGHAGFHPVQDHPGKGVLVELSDKFLVLPGDRFALGLLLHYREEQTIGPLVQVRQQVVPAAGPQGVLNHGLVVLDIAEDLRHLQKVGSSRIGNSALPAADCLMGHAHLIRLIIMNFVYVWFHSSPSF